MDNRIIKNGIKNTIFVLLAQTISLILGIAKILILPILLGVTNYGYWQVYLLYITYVGIFTLGYNDGIYLRYGKFNYNDLPQKIFRSSIKFFVVSQLGAMLLVSILITLEPDPNKQMSMFWASLNIPIAGLTGVFIYILQVTNQLKKYSFYTVLDKLVVILLIFILFFLKADNFLYIIIADTFSKIFLLILIGYSCRDLLIGKGSGFQTAYKETYENVRVGIKLMLANLSGMLVLGFGRFLVERFESVEVYGIYSLAISTINLVLVFITAVGLVVYPTLNRIEENKYSIYFNNINKIISVLVFGLLIVYFPLRVFINSYMVDYILVFEYLPMIFTIVFIQTKMQILINPFYKLLRKEKTMLYANIVGLLMAVVLVVSLYFIVQSVLMVALGTFIAMFVRMYLSEIYLMKYLGVKWNKSIIFEISGIILFVIFAYQSNIIIGFICYFTVFFMYFISQVNTIKGFFQYFSRR